MSNSLFEHSIYVSAGAQFSMCRTWRYVLWRVWDKSILPMNVIGLNPSTADETHDDPTIRRCLDFARRWGYGGLYMTNAFAFRATLPKDMKKAACPIGQDNDMWLKSIADRAGLVLAAWGVHGSFMDRDRAICEMIPNLHCFRITKGGMPEHPLYLPKTLTPVPYLRNHSSAR